MATTRKSARLEDVPLKDFRGSGFVKIPEAAHSRTEVTIPDEAYSRTERQAHNGTFLEDDSLKKGSEEKQWPLTPRREAWDA